MTLNPMSFRVHYFVIQFAALLMASRIIFQKKVHSQSTKAFGERGQFAITAKVITDCYGSLTLEVIMESRFFSK